jgi:alanyl-tRNA synthetase
MKTSQQIRQEFIDFFTQRHGHTFVPSSPVVPLDDPTLLFTNAGMNQFKPIFLGQEKRSYTRAANTQKCIRAGGKHNDLDDVGRSRRHHTFFEMLGNWSFGDYFKRGAIEMSWELLTKVWKLDPTRLHVSCFEGDEKNGVPRDTESANIWKEVAGLPDDHIHYFGKDNFWEMGETGPCGPCTEIYIDRTPDKSGGKHVNGEDPRVMEIWNNVFIQYNRNPDRSLTTLPSQHVDTGMGFERITQVLQNVDSNYEIDLFHPFWEALTKLSGIKYAGMYPPSNATDPAAEAASPQLRHDIAFRVIADHVRCLTFALTDGAVPTNEGRGYVLRRILRRAVRFGRQTLELKEPFLHTLVPVVVEAMGGAFPELKKNPGRVAEIIKDEEVSFGRTLDRGVKLFEDAAEMAYDRLLQQSGAARQFAEEEFNAGRGVSDMKGGFKPFKWDRYVGPPKAQIDAESAFVLHDTFGFPIDLTRIMAEERGMSVDLEGYQKLMERARELARSGGEKGDARLWELPPDALAKLQATGVTPTDDSAKFNAAPIGATVRAIWDGNRLIDQTHGAEAAGQGVTVILDKTNFYAEMGGQVGDTGEFRAAGGGVFDVTTTRSAGGFVLHVGQMIEGHLQVGEHVTATLAGVRPRTEKNHTTTHLANWALREVLGDDVQQKGSLVDPEKLRFDFSHGKSLSDDELGRIETLVNENIAKKLPVYAEEAPQEQALKIHGLRAVFGEKYPPMVRVVSIGAPVAELLKDPSNPKWRQFSVEFCGGTHLKNAGDAQGFVVTAEESVSKGIRRIVALTGDAATQSQQLAGELRAQAERARSLPEQEIPAAITTIQKQLTVPGLPLREKRRAQAVVTELQGKFKAFEKASRQQGAGGVDPVEAASKLLADAPDLGGGKLIVGEISGASDDQLRTAMDSLKKKTGSYAVMLASSADVKVTFIAAVSDDLIAKGLKAGDWVRETAKIAGGGGGGRPQMAQAGGKDPSKVGDALETAKTFASGAVK